MPRKEDNEGYIRFPDAATKARVWQKLNEYKGLQTSLKQASVFLPEALERALDVAITQAKVQISAEARQDGTPPHASTGGSSPSDNAEDGRESAILADGEAHWSAEFSSTYNGKRYENP